MVGKSCLLLLACILAYGTHASRMSYGTGMACSFFEGYLNYILPSKGPDARGLVENMRISELELGINFPVKKIFIIITKSLYCATDLQRYNKANKSLASLEYAQPLKTIVRNEAGDVQRTYSAHVYQIHRPGRASVYVTAECATPLHTFYLANRNPMLAPVFENVDIKEEVADFTQALNTLFNTNSIYKDKCELVHFDDTNSQQNLADVLLAKIRAIEPDFQFNY